MRVESRPIFKKQRRQYRIKEFQSCGDDAWCDYHPPYLRFWPQNSHHRMPKGIEVDSLYWLDTAGVFQYETQPVIVWMRISCHVKVNGVRTFGPQARTALTGADDHCMKDNEGRPLHNVCAYLLWTPLPCQTTLQWFHDRSIASETMPSITEKSTPTPAKKEWLELDHERTF